MTERIAEASPRFKARMAAVFYLLVFVTGAFALVFVSGRLVANLIATGCYIAVTEDFTKSGQRRRLNAKRTCSVRSTQR